MKEHCLHKANVIIAKIEAAGHEAYIVGGAVRDFFLKREIHDIDIATSASPELIKSLFPKTIDVAIKHGTVIVRYQGESFEVTSFRGKTLIDDLKLRDFTINAMALTKDGNVIDPCLGQAAIKKKLICGVESPEQRFVEDPLRMLRAIRFVSELSFEIEESTFFAFQLHKDKINDTAVERIASEFSKICLGKNVAEAFSLLLKTKITEAVKYFRELQKAIYMIDSKQAFFSCTNMTEAWVLLLYFSGQEHPKVFLRMWKQPKKVIDEVVSILNRLPSIVKRGFTLEDLYCLGMEKAQMAERVRATIQNESPNISQLTTAYNLLPIKAKKQIAMNGKEIVALLKEPDDKRRIGELLTLIENAILTKGIENTEEAITSWLREEGFISEK